MNTNKLDGMDSLRKLFDNDDEIFVNHVIHNILFFKKDKVKEQALDIRHQIRMGQAIPVRYTSNGAYFLQHTSKRTTPSFKNKREALLFTDDNNNALFHRETKIRVCFDKSGNYYPRQTIFEKTGYHVSCGERSTIINYIISHIWNKTDNPLYFGLLWNYCLIPCHLAFLTDKRDDTHWVIERVKNLVKAISIELYNPNRLMDWNQNVITEEDMPYPEDKEQSKAVLKEARQLIKEEKLKFVPEIAQ
jgi:hypothetical protein